MFSIPYIVYKTLFPDYKEINEQNRKKKSFISQSFCSFGNMAWTCQHQWQLILDDLNKVFSMLFSELFCISKVSEKKKIHELAFIFTYSLSTQTLVSSKTTFLFTLNMLDQLIKYLHRIYQNPREKRRTLQNMYI